MLAAALKDDPPPCGVTDRLDRVVVEPTVYVAEPTLVVDEVTIWQELLGNTTVYVPVGPLCK